MTEPIKRSDSLNIDHIIDYLEEHNIVKDNVLLSSQQKTKNVVGNDISEIPAITDNYIKTR